MRDLMIGLFAIAILGGAGCGGGQEEPRTPTSVTQDEISKMDQEQQAVDAAEREQRKSNR